MTSKILQQISFIVLISLSFSSLSSLFSQTDPTQVPVAVCEERLTINISDSPILDASQLDAGSSDNQTASEDLRFAITRQNEELILPDETDFGSQNSIEFSLEDVCTSLFILITVWDEDDNMNSCFSTVIIIDDNSDCSNSENTLACLDLVTAAIADEVVIFPQDLLTDAAILDTGLLLSINGSDPFEFFTFREISPLEFLAEENIRPPGTYNYLVIDSKNSNSCWGTLEILSENSDTEVPVAICSDSITIDITAGSRLNIEDINNGSFDGQTSSEDLVFSIARIEEELYGPDNNLFGTQTQILFTEQDICNIVLVAMAVFDQDGNSNLCLAEVFVSRPDIDCAFSANLTCFDRIFYVSGENKIRVSTQDLNNDLNTQYLLEIDGIDKSQNGIDFAFFGLEDVGSYTYKLINSSTQTSCKATIEIKNSCPAETCPNSITVEDKIVQPNEAFCITINGEFEGGLGSLQTAIRWNPDLLTYESINKGNFSNEIVIGNVNQEEGYVPFTFFNSFLDESIKIINFEVCFIAGAENNVSSSIDLSRGIPGLLFEASSVSPVGVIPVSIMNGTVVIGDPNLIPPACDIEIICQDATKNCADELSDIQVPEYGSPDNCALSDLVVKELRRIDNQNGCGEGSVSIEYYIDLDGSNDLSIDEPFCRSTILLTNGEDFDPLTIRWPASINGTTIQGDRINEDGSRETDVEIVLEASRSCLATDELQQPTWCSQDCGIVGFAYEDEILIDNEGSCSTIKRTWTIIDWCAFEPVSPDSIPQSGEISYIEDLSDGSSCEQENSSTESIYAAYNSVDKTGFYSYVQYINIEDNSAPTVIEVPGQNAVPVIYKSDEGDKAILSLKANDFCLGASIAREDILWNINLTRILSTDEVVNDIDPITKEGTNIVLSRKDFLVVEETEAYKIDVTAADGCGNRSNQVSFLVIVSEENACWSFDRRQCDADGFASSVNENASAEDMAEAMKGYLASINIPTSSVIADKNFNQNVCEACAICPTGTRFFIQLENSDDQEKLFLIDLLNLQATDCNTTERPVVADGNVAIHVYPVSDKITEIGSFSVNDEKATFLGQSTFSIPESVINDTNNTLRFKQQPGSALNGVSTFDVVLLQKILLGLDSAEPIKAIAGDVDKSGDITFTKDIVMMKRLIFGITTEIPGGNYFITSRNDHFSAFDAFNFTPDFDQYNFNEADVDPTQGIEIEIHKYGDLNDNFAVPRTDGKVILSTDNSSMTSGKTEVLTFHIDNFNLDPYVGIQFGLALQDMEIIEVIHDYGADLVYHLSDNHDNIKIISSNRELESKESFEIKLKVNVHSNENLVNMVSIDQSFTTEYITDGLQVLPIEMELKDVSDQELDIKDSNEIKAYPNPAKEAFTISVPADLIGTQIRIYNTTGQLEYSHLIDSQKMIIGKDELKSGGIKIVKLDQDNYLKVTIL